MRISRLSAAAQGYIVANSIGIGLALFTKILVNGRLYMAGATLVYSEFIIIPILMGLIGSWCWRKERLRTGKLIGRSFICALIAIVLSFLFLGEGTICLVIVSPLLITFIAVGAFIGKALFIYDDTTLNFSLFGLLLLLFFADTRSNHHYENMVADKMVINAPVAKVWPLVVAYKKIEEPPRFGYSV